MAPASCKQERWPPLGRTNGRCKLYHYWAPKNPVEGRLLTAVPSKPLPTLLSRRLISTSNFLFLVPCLCIKMMRGV
jgi:hypothetical protein